MTKTTKHWITGTAVVALILLTVPSLVVAQMGGRGGERAYETHGSGGMGPGHLERFQELLELSEDQVAKIQSLRLEHQQAQTRLRGRIAAAEAELEALLMDAEVSRSKVLAAGRELQELRDQAATQRLEHRMDFRELLTPEQRAELVQMGGRLGAGAGLHRRHGMWGQNGLPHDLHRSGRGMGPRMRWFEEPEPAAPPAPDEPGANGNSGERL